MPGYEIYLIDKLWHSPDLYVMKFGTFKCYEIYSFQHVSAYYKIYFGGVIPKILRTFNTSYSEISTKGCTLMKRQHVRSVRVVSRRMQSVTFSVSQHS